MASFRRKGSTSIHLVKSQTTFANHFQLLYNDPSGKFLSSSCSECLSLSPISDSDIFKVLKRLKPFKSVGLDKITGFLIKGFSDILALVLKPILI